MEMNAPSFFNKLVKIVFEVDERKINVSRFGK